MFQTKTLESLMVGKSRPPAGCSQVGGSPSWNVPAAARDGPPWEGLDEEAEQNYCPGKSRARTACFISIWRFVLTFHQSEVMRADSRTPSEFFCMLNELNTGNPHSLRTSCINVSFFFFPLQNLQKTSRISGVGVGAGPIRKEMYFLTQKVIYLTFDFW